MVRIAFLLVASTLVFITSAETADKPKDAPVALERKLHGEWKGGLCMGELTLRADGTFERQHYTPGNNDVAGTWEVRWNSLPPTLVLTCKTSDESDRFPAGKITEVKLVQLDDAVLAYEDPEYLGGQPIRYTRVAPIVRANEKTHEKELAALQGTWVPLQYEAGGKIVPGAMNFKQIVKGDKVTFQVDGETKAEGKVVLDPTQNPKHLNFQFTSGQTDLIVYVRAGDQIIYCGNRDGKTRPSEFVSGTATGGEYLIAWKIEKWSRRIVDRGTG